MREIRKIDKKSLAGIVSIFYGLAGLGVFLAIVISSLLNIIISKDFSGPIVTDVLFNLGLGLVVGVIVGLFTAVFGWILGFIWAAIYNLAAPRIGGIKIEMIEKEEGQKEIIS